MKEIFLEYINKYESGFTLFSHDMFGNSFFSWLNGLVLLYLFIAVFDIILLKILHPKFDYNKDGKSDIHFYNYIDSKVNKKTNENINLSVNKINKENINLFKKWFLIFSKNYIKFTLTSKKYISYVIIILWSILSIYSVSDMKNSYEDLYKAYLDEVNETVTYDIVEIKKEFEDFIVTYLDEENKLQDIKLKRNDFALDMEVNLDNPKLNEEVLGYIEFKNPIDIDYVKKNLESDDINLDDYKSFFETLENQYDELIFEKATIFDLDYLK